MPTHHSLFQALLGVACLALPASAAVPEKVQKDLDKAGADYDRLRESAEKKLSDTFETEQEAVRKSPNFKGSVKLEMVAELAAEKATFEKHGTIPFSPRLRTAAMAYMKALQQARTPFEKAYEKVIDDSIKAKDDATGIARIVDEMKKILKASAVGVWACTGVSFEKNFKYVFNSDGSMEVDGKLDKSTWSLEKDKIVTIHREAGGPAGGWTTNITIDRDGQSFTAVNQAKLTFKGKRVDPPAK